MRGQCLMAFQSFVYRIDSIKINNNRDREYNTFKNCRIRSTDYWPHRLLKSLRRSVLTNCILVIILLVINANIYLKMSKLSL